MCTACAAGLYSECSQPIRTWEAWSEADDRELKWIIPCVMQFSAVQVGNVTVRANGPSVLSPQDVTDPTSTGRKRAAMLAPILNGQLCAWSGLKFAGGGVTPILGCNGNKLIEKKGGEGDLKQGDRHHGPDKNTLNNAVGSNLHSICADCHHSWHAVNDGYYDAAGRPGAAFPFTPVVPYFLHDSVTRFTEEEYAEAQAWWALPRASRGLFPFMPDDSLRVLPTTASTATLPEDDNPFPDIPFTELGASQ